MLLVEHYCILVHDSPCFCVTELQYGYTPLHQATHQGHLNVISVLLKNGASPDCVTNVRYQPNETLL